MDNVFFSIIVPLYNKQDSVLHLLDSIQGQTYDNYEVIVVDDGSTDESVNVVKAHKSNSVKIIQKENGGPSDARNVGIRYAIGDWIIFMDADDCFLPNALEIFHSLIITHKEYSCFAANFIIEDNNGRHLYSKRYNDGEIKNAYYSFVNNKCMLRAGAVAYRKKLLLKTPFKTFLRRYEDLEFGFRIMDQVKIYRCSSPTMIYLKAYSSASKVKTNIKEDFCGYLSLQNDFWKNIAYYRLYLETVKVYPKESRRMYAHFTKRFDLFFFTKVINIKNRMVKYLNLN